MKDFFEKYKELRKNKRLFGIIRLSLWLIPFFIIVIMVRTNGSGNNLNKPIVKEKNYLDNYQSMKIFKFDYQVNDINYTGKFLDNNIVLENENNDILIKDEEIYYAKSDNEFENIYYLYPKNIIDLINESEKTATTSYNDGTIEYIYTRNTDDFNKEIKIKISDNNVLSVSIVEDNIEIKINYYDISNLDFVIDYDRYILNEEAYDNEGEIYEY